MSLEGWSNFYEGNVFKKTLLLSTGFFKRFAHVFKAKDFDFIFIHRELFPIGFPIFEWIIVNISKAKIVYDFDDAIWKEDPNEKGSLKGYIKYKSKIAFIIKNSFVISAGNQYLADYANQYCDYVKINPTTVDTMKLHNPALNRHKDPISSESIPSIGWTGTHSTIHYLTSIVPVLKRLSSEYSFKFIVISNQCPNFDLNNMEFIKWSKDTEVEDLMKIDIGIMPLTSDPWSKGKCGFKALQYLSLQKPALVSPIGVNAKIVQHGLTGFHCNTEEDWYKYISILFNHKDLGIKMGRKGRAFVKEFYSVESNKENFLSLFEVP